jgi:hypothetical protein
MKIETKFNVGEKVRHLHQTNEQEGGKIEFLVLQITTETCHGGTQAWYKCRPLIDIFDKYDKIKPIRKEPRFEIVNLSEIEIESAV